MESRGKGVRLQVLTPIPRGGSLGETAWLQREHRLAPSALRARTRYRSAGLSVAIR